MQKLKLAPHSKPANTALRRVWVRAVRVPRPSSPRSQPTPLPVHSAQPRRRLSGLQGRVDTWHHQLARVHRGVPCPPHHTLTNLELPTSRLLSSPSSTALCRSWAILFSHPNDFMPVCTTELGSVESLKDEFQRRGVKVAALSCNDVESHGVCQPVELTVGTAVAAHDSAGS